MTVKSERLEVFEDPTKEMLFDQFWRRISDQPFEPKDLKDTVGYFNQRETWKNEENLSFPEIRLLHTEKHIK